MYVSLVATVLLLLIFNWPTAEWVTIVLWVGGILWASLVQLYSKRENWRAEVDKDRNITKSNFKIIKISFKDIGVDSDIDTSQSKD